MSHRTLGMAVVLLLVAAPRLCAALTPGELNEAGKSAYERADFARAERLFGEAAAGAPGEPLFHYHRGAALVRLGRLAEARASYERALALNPPPPLAASIDAAVREVKAPPPAVRIRTVEPSLIRLETAHGVWFAEVMLNGTRRAKFMIDTGAAWCHISPELAAELGIRIPFDARVVNLITGNGRTTGRLVSLASIRVGEIEATDVPTVVLPLERGFVDGILGNTFLAKYAVTLDAQRRLLYLSPRQ